MSWLIGYGHPKIVYVCGTDGAVHANGVRVTEANGWLVVPCLPLLANRSGIHAPPEVRVRVGADEHGFTLLYLEQVRRGGRDYGDLMTFAASEGHDWVLHFHRQVPVELLKRLVAARAAREGMRTPAALSDGERP